MKKPRVPARRNRERTMHLDWYDLGIARHALRERAAWAAARGFFWLSERDLRMLERLEISGYLTAADERHLRSVLARVGGADNEALDRRMRDRI